MSECIFCKIVGKEIPSQFVAEDDDMVVFKDIDPQAPVHLLLVPRKHIATTNDLTESDGNLVGKMILKAAELAQGNKELAGGYRLVFNCNRDGGQAVYHIHLHLLGGRRMTWPPG